MSSKPLDRRQAGAAGTVATEELVARIHPRRLWPLEHEVSLNSLNATLCAVRLDSEMHVVLVMLGRHTAHAAAVDPCGARIDQALERWQHDAAILIEAELDRDSTVLRVPMHLDRWANTLLKSHRSALAPPPESQADLTKLKSAIEHLVGATDVAYLGVLRLSLLPDARARQWRCTRDAESFGCRSACRPDSF